MTQDKKDSRVKTFRDEGDKEFEKWAEENLLSESLDKRMLVLFENCFWKGMEAGLDATLKQIRKNRE